MSEERHALIMLQEFDQQVDSFIGFLEEALCRPLNSDEKKSAEESVRKSYSDVMMPVLCGN